MATPTLAAIQWSRPRGDDMDQHRVEAKTADQPLRAPDPDLAIEQETGDAPARPIAVPGLAKPPLTVGHAHDPAEADADRMADVALTRIQADPVVHRSTAGAATGQIGLAGGPVDAGTENQIASRVGSGAPLDSPVRREMETAFGRSFGQVGVHTDGRADELNGTLSSTAFTVGNDIFFSRGSFRPDDPDGKRLLAHELAHVTQEGKGAHREIRRAVGFEFETSVPVHKKAPDGSPKPTVKLPKAHKIKIYPEGFRMESDENTGLGSTIEFVVDPPVEEGDRKKLIKIMKKMTEVAAAIAYNEPTTDYVTPTKKLKDIPKTDVDDDEILALPKKNLVANPQVTGGISFDKVIDMMGEIGEGDQKDVKKKDKNSANELEKMTPQNPAAMATKIKSAAPPVGLTKVSKELQGFAALMGSYLEVGAAGGAKTPLNYAKLISGSMLVRTDFGSLFMKLPEAERKVLSVNYQSYMDWLLGIVGLAGKADDPVFERGVYKNNAPRKGPNADVTLSDAAELKITRRDWIMGITGGVDWLSAKRFEEYKDTLEGLGGIGKNMDKVGKGKKKEGVVMEFRKMRQDVFYEEWADLAVGIFDYLSNLNAR
jgi:hypothetical protein